MSRSPAERTEEDLDRVPRTWRDAARAELRPEEEADEEAVAGVFRERAVRREGDREVALGPKAQRTRETILEAAAAQFTSKGYQRTSVADVAAASGVSLGTVYQYFRDRPDLVAALVHRSVTRMFASQATRWRADEGIDGLRHTLEAYVANYIARAPLSKVWDEVSHTDEDLEELRRTLGRIFTGAVERELRRAARAGLIRRDLDPGLAARALASMVDRYCYSVYAFDPPEGGPPDVERSAETLAKLWSGAVGLR